MIHAGDWAKYVASRDAAVFRSLDAPAEDVAKYLADADRRKSEVREKKNSRK